jgi:hypothetical protein
LQKFSFLDYSVKKYLKKCSFKGLVERFNVEHFTMYDIDDEEQIEILKEMKDYQSVKELMLRRTEVYLPDNTI